MVYIDSHDHLDRDETTLFLYIIFLPIIIYWVYRFVTRYWPFSHKGSSVNKNKFIEGSSVNKNKSIAGNNNELFPHRVTTQKGAQKENFTPLELPRKFRKGLHGIVRNLNMRTITANFSTSQEISLSFRLEVIDEIGNVIQELPVELRAEVISGQVMHNGDEVIVNGKKNRYGYIVSTGVYIVNTNSEIATRKKGFFYWIFALPMGLLFFPAIFAIPYGIIIASVSEGSEDIGNGIAISVAGGIFTIIYYLVYIRK